VTIGRFSRAFASSQNYRADNPARIVMFDPAALGGAGNTLPGGAQRAAGSAGRTTAAFGAGLSAASAYRGGGGMDEKTHRSK
jgi:hypothetical protein